MLIVVMNFTLLLTLKLSPIASVIDVMTMVLIGFARILLMFVQRKSSSQYKFRQEYSKSLSIEEKIAKEQSEQ